MSDEEALLPESENREMEEPTPEAEVPQQPEQSQQQEELSQQGKQPQEPMHDAEVTQQPEQSQQQEELSQQRKQSQEQQQDEIQQQPVQPQQESQQQDASKDWNPIPPMIGVDLPPRAYLKQRAQEAADLRNQHRRCILFCICIFLTLVVSICVTTYFFIYSQPSKIQAYRITYEYLDSGETGNIIHPTKTHPVQCPYSPTPGRLEGFTPKSVKQLQESCFRCLKRSLATTSDFCKKWCANIDSGDLNSEPWMVLSRRNFARDEGSSPDCIFENPLATKEKFASGFSCDEEVFLGLDKIAEATDPTVANQNMFEVRVVISDHLNRANSRGNRDLAHRIGGEIRKEFYIDSLFNIFYELDPAKKTGSSSKLLPKTGNGAGFCVNDTAAKASAAGGSAKCDPDVKGGYWKGGKSGEMTLCAACCREIDFGDLPVGKKVVEVLFRHVRCLEDERSTSEEEFRYQLKIPPVLECFDEGASNEVELKTPMGRTRIIGGKNRNTFWCSPSGGMKILERNLDEDSPRDSKRKFPNDQKCVFEARKSREWDQSKYKRGFGCSNQFFIGTDNAKKLSDGNTGGIKSTASRRLHKGILKLNVVYGEDGKAFAEQADIAKMGKNGLILALDQSTTSLDSQSILQAAYTQSVAARFCTDEDVTKCAGLKSRWWLMRQENVTTNVNEYTDNVCFTCCDSKQLIKVGKWKKRDIKMIQMFINHN